VHRLNRETADEDQRCGDPRDGDAPVVTKLDRLARSVPHLLDIVDRVLAKGAHLDILNLGSLDPATATGKLLLTMIGAIAAFEREMMLERQREGIAKAKADGKYKGQPPHARAKAARVLELAAEGETRQKIGEVLKISERSVYRILADGAARLS
jgi:DNA invertase Pin-like site-specific DNA recombinase